MIRSIICWFFHRAHHAPLRREGDYSLVCCARCENDWIMPRLDEHARMGAVVHVGADNPYDLGDWHATRDGYDPGEPDGDGGYDGGSPIGRGRTKYEAIRELLDLEEVRS